MDKPIVVAGGVTELLAVAIVVALCLLGVGIVLFVRGRTESKR